MVFRIPGGNQLTPTDIKTLFTQLGKLERMSYQQRDAVTAYEEIRNSKRDIAIEMPAGHGKTLVGGLIGEFNRITKNWRVVYTCATRQLAYQTAELLNSYGIKSTTLVGKVSELPQQDLGKYQRSQLIAVTTYSHIFNTRPAFPDAQLIIFDDAHAAEYAIQGFWGLQITRSEFENVFLNLISELGDVIATHVKSKIIYGNYDPLTDGIDIIPVALWAPRMYNIQAFLDQHTDGTKLYYPWTRIRNHLHACQIYLSHNTISIQPVLPPNLRHPAFAGAEERIYMSATIGEAGELERVFGVPEIHRICPFDDSTQKVSGRRLILFPNDHFEEEDLDKVVLDSVKNQPRTLVLTPSKRISSSLENYFKVNTQHTVLGAADVEDDMSPFTGNDSAVLVLHGRYEGIDLKDEQCRFQIIYDLPTGISMQDKFLLDRLNATELFENMLLTRVTQGLGRCTRGNDDYAVVLFLGRNVGQHLYKNEFRQMLPPEIDAELEFAFAQVDNIKTIEQWNESVRVFLQQGEEWQDVESWIRGTTEQKKRDRLKNPLNELFKNAIKHEINYLYHVWEKEWDRAHREIDSVIQIYSKVPTLNGYRAWWNYLIACIGVHQNNREKEHEYHRRAICASTYKLWLDKRLFDEPTVKQQIQLPPPLELQVQRIIENLKRYGDHHRKFENKMEQIRVGLNQKEAKLYELSMRDWGEFLGFSSNRPNGNGVPDGYWGILNDWFVFEMKTDIDNPDGEIPLDDLRQAQAHASWFRHNVKNVPEDEITTVMICAKQRVSSHSAHATENLFLVHPDYISELFTRTEHINREVKNELRYNGEEAAINKLVTLLQNNRLDVFSIREHFKAKPIVDCVQF
ncbi:helicase C-terminal domain-containing protein [Brevibacillus sp. FSL K6-2834]|uniref:helicase C-terminal domain-containing protein n=1 Tax=Brevibacillus sp. FSL K6-2834 TaxID=2954680 RepID=UPI0031587853